METKIQTTRSSNSDNDTDGTLILSEVNQSSCKSITIDGVKITAKFGDIFENHNTAVVVVPNFSGGMIYNKMCQINHPIDAKVEIPYNSQSIYTVPSYIHGIKQFILYRYDNTTQHFEADFEKMASISQKDEILVLPTFGTRNGMTFYQVATRIFDSLITCLRNPDTSFKQLGGVMIITPFDSNQDSQSSRVIKHLFNLMTVEEKSTNEPDCLICYDHKRNAILGCGHRIACERCIMDTSEIVKQCPLCKQNISRSYPCYNVIDMSSHDCGHTDSKSGKIYVPCGHYNATCDQCDTKAVADKRCPICHDPIMASIKLYQ